jgi:hypothetical protein
MSNRVWRPGLLVRPPVPVAKLSSNTSTSDLTTYTFAGLDLGAEHPDRKHFGALTIRATGAITISTVTLGGTSMISQVAAANTTGGNRSHAAIFACAKPTGATGDLVITMSGAGSVRAGYTLYRAIAPTLTALSPKTAVTDTPSDTIDIPARGFAIGVCMGGNNATAAAWTGLTEDTDTAMETQLHTTALLSRHDAIAGLSVGVSLTGVSGGLSAFAMAAFGY